MSVSLDEEEVSALMSAIQEGRVAPAAKESQAEAIPYDLASQDRIIRGQMPTLDAINERIASLLGIGLTGRTRCSLKVAATPASLLKFLDFNILLAPPATVCVIALGGGSGQAVAVLEPGLAEALLAAALGDRRARPEPAPEDGRRELTGVERLVLRRLLTILTEAMATAWAPVLPFRPELLRFETDPRMAVIAPPNEVAIVSSFEIAGAITGRLQLAIPYAVVEPAKKALTSPPRLATERDARFAAALAEELSRVGVEVRARLGSTQVPLERLLALDIGDVLVLSTSEGEPLPITVQGRPKLAGAPLVVAGNLAVRVEQGLAPLADPPLPAPPVVPAPAAPAPAGRAKVS